MQYSECSGNSSVDQHHLDLMKLADLAGLSMKPQILSILIEMLGMNIHPNSLHSLLKDISNRRGKERTSRTDARPKSKRPSEKPIDAKTKT